MKGKSGNLDLSMLQIKADLRLAKTAMDDSRTAKPSKYAKYPANAAVYIFTITCYTKFCKSGVKT